MLKDNFSISSLYLKELNAKVTESEFLLESLEEKKKKLNNDYKRQLNSFYLYYIEYKSILAKDFSINVNELRQASTMIYNSRIFTDKEEQFFEAIRFFRSKPYYFARLIDERNEQSDSKVSQSFIDFIVVSLFPSYLNSMCNCRQPHNLFVFMRSILELELSTISNFSEVLERGRVTEQIFNALLKKIDTHRFIEKMLSKLRSCFMRLEEGSEDHSSHTSGGRERKRENSDKGAKSQSSKYQNLLDSYKYSRQPGAKRLSLNEPSMILNNQNTVLAVFEEEVVELDEKRVDKKILEDALEAMIDCITHYLPLEIKLFFYLLQGICSRGTLKFRNVIKLYWFQRFLIASLNKGRLLTWLDTYQGSLRKQMSDLLKTLLKYCNNFKEDEAISFHRLEEALTRVPFKLAKQLLKDPLPKVSPKKKRRTILRDEYSIPNSDHNVISNCSNNENGFSEDMFKYCSYHNESLVINFQDLANLIDLYGKVLKNNSGLVQKLSQVLSSKEVGNFTLNPLKSEKIYIVFNEDMREKDKLTSIKPKGSIERLLRLNFLTDELIDYFEGCNLKAVLKHHKNFHMAGGSSIQEEELFSFYYDPNLVNIFITEGPDRYSKGEEETAENKLANEITELDAKYTKLTNKIQAKLTQLSYKKKEIMMLEGELSKYREFKKRVIEQNLLDGVREMIKMPLLDLCLEAKSNKPKDLRKGFFISAASECCSPQLETAKLIQCEAPGHVHFRLLTNLLDFLKQHEYVVRYVKEDKCSKSLRDLIMYLREFLLDKLIQYVDPALIKEYNRLTNKDESILTLFDRYYTGIIFHKLFSRDLASQDEGFRVYCAVLDFVTLEKFFQNKTPPVESGLGPTIRELGKIAEAQSFYDKLQLIKDCLQRLVGVLTTATGKVPGSEEVHPLFVYCLLKAKPSGWLSTNSFMTLCVPEDQNKGEAGFIITQVVLATRIIETINKNNLRDYNFEKHILENEIRHGVHLIRRRSAESHIYGGINNLDALHI